MSDFQKYLHTIVKNDKHISDVVNDNQFMHRVFNLTIDQLKHEETLIDQEIGKVKSQFSHKEISTKDRYVKICHSHSSLTNSHDGIMVKLTHRTNDLQKTSTQFTSVLSKIDHDLVREQHLSLKDQESNLDRVVEIFNIPNIINQCLQANCLVQAIKLVRHFEENISK